MTQEDDELNVHFGLKSPAKRKELAIVMRRTRLSVVHNDRALIEGALYDAIVPDESTWVLANGGTEIQLMLTLADPSKRWPQLLQEPAGT